MKTLLFIILLPFGEPPCECDPGFTCNKAGECEEDVVVDPAILPEDCEPGTLECE